MAAEGLRIEFDLDGAASLVAKREDAAPLIGSFEMPEPPEKPGSFLSSLNPTYLHTPGLYDAMKPRDPVAFYWFRRPEIGAKHSALQCQDFRATREWRDRIFVLPAGNLPAQVGLRLHVSAANLRAPITVPAKVIISERAVGWADPAVQGILPDWIRGFV